MRREVRSQNGLGSRLFQLLTQAAEESSRGQSYHLTDCCASRLSDYWLVVSNSPFLATDTPGTLAGRAGTFASHQTSAPNPSMTIPVGTQGRYVRVQLSGTDYLSLAEVQIQ